VLYQGSLLKRSLSTALIIILCTMLMINTSRNVRTHANSLGASNKNFSALMHEKAVFVIKQTSENNFLGMFIRGEDLVSVSGSLVTQDGTPVSNADIYVYLNISDSEVLYIGKFKTNASGYFNVTFSLPLTVPVGNRTLTIYFPGDPTKGLGPTNAYYWMIVCGRVHVEIRLSSKQLALFDNNVSFSAWIYLDNGTRVEREGMNLTFLVVKDDVVLHTYNLTTSTEGIVRSVIEFSSPGTYIVSARFNISASSNNLGEWILADGQYIENNTIKGIPISIANESFTVYLATKIKMRFLGTLNATYYANRRGESITIIGQFYNVTGLPDEETLNLTILYEGADIFYSTLLSSNSSGFFSLFLTVNSSYPPGQYVIICKDTNVSTVDLADTLSIRVISELGINITQISPNLSESIIKTGSVIYIEGLIYDKIDGSRLSDAQVIAYLGYDDDKYLLNETRSGVNGLFNISLQIRENIPTDRISVILSVKLSPFFRREEVSLEFEVYNYFVINVRLNESEFTWFLRDGNLYAQNEPVLSDVLFPASLRVTITFSDDFNRSRSFSKVTVLRNGTKILEISDESHYVFEIDVNSTTNLTFIIHDFDVRIMIYIEGRQRVVPEPGGGALTLPSHIILLLVLLIPFPIALLFFSGVREFIAGKRKAIQMDSFSILLNVDKYRVERNFREMANQIRAFFLQLAKELGFSPPRHFTVREIFSQLIKTKKEIINASKDLEFLINIYEKIVYGYKELEEREMRHLKDAITNLYIFLKSIREKPEGKKGG